jgi:hypothetical protein
MNSKSRLLVASVTITTAIVGGLFLSSAFAKQQRNAMPKEVLSIPSRTASYTPGNFTFTAPLELTGHPPSPAFFQSDGEPEIGVFPVARTFGNRPTKGRALPFWDNPTARKTIAIRPSCNAWLLAVATIRLMFPAAAISTFRACG